jgi:hypothetical protein
MIHGQCDVSHVKGCVSHQKTSARVVHAAPSGVVIARCWPFVFFISRAHSQFLSAAVYLDWEPAEGRGPGACHPSPR